MTKIHSARPWKYFQVFSLRSKRNISLWAGDASRKYLFVFSDLKRMSCAGVEVASDNLKMRMPDSSGCRSSLSLLSTRQVCHLNYPPFCVVSVKCQHWAGDEGIACSVPMDAPYSPGCLHCCQSPAGRKGAEQELRTPCLQKDPPVVQCLRGKEGGNDGVIRAKLPKSHFHLILVSLLFLYSSFCFFYLTEMGILKGDVWSTI